MIVLQLEWCHNCLLSYYYYYKVVNIDFTVLYYLIISVTMGHDILCITCAATVLMVGRQDDIYIYIVMHVDMSNKIHSLACMHLYMYAYCMVDRY